MSPRRAQATVGHRPLGGWAVACLLLLAPYVRPAPLRADVVDDLKRLNPHLQNDERIPRRDLKWMTLAESPYIFFRGTCDLYAEWFKAHCSEFMDQGQPKVRLHGDVHPGNCGTYEPLGKFGSGELTFGLVDMDETFDGPIAYDLIRGMTALRFIGAERKLKGFDSELLAPWESINMFLIDSYAAQFGVGRGSAEALKNSKIIRKRLKKARKSDAAEYVQSYVDFSGTTPAFRRLRFDDGELEDITFAIEDSSVRNAIIDAFLAALRRDRSGDFATHFDTGATAKAQILDVASWIRFGSSGSQGLSKFLMLTKPARMKGFPYQIYQLKQEPACAATRAGLIDPTKTDNRAQFVAASYKILQHPPKALTGWTTIGSQSFLVKPKIHNGKEPKPKHMDDEQDLADMAQVMGALLSTAHQRSGFTKAELTKFMECGNLINERADACYLEAVQQYREFRAHPQVIAARKRALAWIESHQKQQPRASQQKTTSTESN